MHAHNGILHSFKKGWQSAICKCMDEPGGHYVSEISQTKKEKHCMASPKKKSNYKEKEEPFPFIKLTIKSYKENNKLFS